MGGASLATLGALIVLLGLLAILAGIISVIWPLRFLKIGSRRTGLFVLIGGFLTFVVGGLLLPEDVAPDTDALVAGQESTTSSTWTASTTAATTTTVAPTTTDLATTTTERTSTSTTRPTTTTEPRTQESEITEVVHEILGDSLVETEIIVTMNVSDNLTMNMIGGGFEIDAGELMIALYKENPDLDVRWVAVDGLFPLTDQYGNTEPGEVVSIRFVEEEADRVNWDTPESTLTLDILPGLYEWLFIHPELQEHLP